MTDRTISAGRLHTALMAKRSKAFEEMEHGPVETRTYFTGLFVGYQNAIELLAEEVERSPVRSVLRSGVDSASPLSPSETIIAASVADAVHGVDSASIHQ